jgi:hypothetical protein
MRRAAAPAIPPSLYRHFAIVTVVVAAGLALFAEGDNREAQAAQVAQVRPDGRATPPVIARASPTDATGSTSGGWDEVDFDSSFGAPMDEPTGSGTETDPDEDSPSDSSPERPATLSPMEREVLLRGLQEHAAPAPGG